MQIENEGLLTQLGYHPDSATLAQLQTIEEKTPGFEKIKKHIVALHDHLKNYGGFVALSNSVPHLKVKISDPSKQEIALEELNKWAQKYNVTLQKVQGKETYYIVSVS
ncbi:hypothetical protein [Nitratiruptor sp. SB155-2]|uniref:hypothetical protein n=1 Tax=Nitratiruptor sp. (strain SB155-2) TaxID=387092 RepID=UPI0001586F21|nr:hypothetical protein [Nitratiruptor sp. SB155-2]BAF69552.1 conserved hypothetical protein [Nitratiruptor sp. SB155-2]